MTPLHLAAENGHKYVVRFLFSKGANVDAKNEYEETPLHFAAKNGHKDIVEFLFSKGANVDAKNECEETPLHFAVENEYKDIVEFLLSKGADVNAQNNQGKTPLHLTIKKAGLDIDLDITDIFYTLLNKKGINVNITDNNKDTPLHLFFKRNVMDIDALYYLLDAESINVNLQNIDGNTPLHLVIQKSNWNTLPPYSVHNRKLVVDTLIKMGANVDAVNKYEKTPLHLASSDGHTEIAKALINAEANVDAQDKYGNTPFDLASTEEIKALLKKAAEDPDAGSVDEPSTDSKEDQEEDAGTEKKEGDAKSESDIAEKGTGISNDSQPTGPTQNNGGQPTTSAGQGADVQNKGVNPVAPTEPAQTEEQSSSFFGSLFSILMKPFSLIASFFGGFFSWLFGSDEKKFDTQPYDDFSLPMVDQSIEQNNGDHNDQAM